MNEDGGRKLARLLSVGSMMELRSLKDPRVLPMDSNISFKDSLFLDTIAETEGCTLSKLAEIACVTRPTVTVRIDRLEERGLVRRVRDESDGRRTILELTDGVRAVYRFEEEMLQGIVSELEARHGEESVRAFIDMVSEATSLMASIQFSGSGKDIEPPGQSAEHEDLRGLRARHQTRDV